LKHPGEGVAVISRVLGQLWSSMTNDEKQAYQSKSAEERERVAADLKAWEEDAVASGIVLDSTDGSTNKNKEGENNSVTLLYPSARIRKICKLDPEVRGLSKEALLLVTKAAELFTSLLGNECVRVAQIQNRRTLLPDDVVQICHSRERFEFLREDIQDLTRVQQQQQKDKSSAAATNKSKLLPTNTKPITSFFSSTTSSVAKPSSK
jgi:histone H3/H4